MPQNRGGRRAPAPGPARTAGRPRRPGAPRRGRWRRRLAWTLGSLVGLALVGLGAATTAAAVLWVTTPELSVEFDIEPTVVTDVNGDHIGELQEHPGREDLGIDELPPHVVDAVIAAEDAGFRDHAGVSVSGIARATWSNLRHGEVRQGGSTITQQYVKNLTGDQEETLARKLREAVLAVRLERDRSKDEILEGYLNSIYFGRGAYGIQAAARAYFDVDARDLTVDEAAQLAAVVPAPSALDPEREPVASSQRYASVIDRMHAEGMLDREEASELREVPPLVRPGGQGLAAQRAPHFLAMVEQRLADLVGPAAVHRGLEVRTSLDLRAQDAAERAHADALGSLDIPEGETAPVAALVAIDPATGGIRAHVAGADFGTDQYDLVTGGPEGLGRQPGSTFKPFALAAFVEDGNSPDSMVDAPATATFAAEDARLDSDWTVGNYEGQELGSVTLREATWRSSNTAYAQLAMDLGPERVLNAARRAGVDAPGKLRPDPSLVLGTGAVTPLELAGAYSTFAAEGTRRAPTAVLEVVDHEGERQYRANTDGDRAFEPEVAHAVTDVLRGVITSGTGTAAAIGRPAAGKTGTTSSHADAWFAGYTPDLAAVAWFGHRDDNEPIHGAPTGGGAPAALWADFVAEALADVAPSEFPPPPDDLPLAEDLADALCEPGDPACDEPATPGPPVGPDADGEAATDAPGDASTDGASDGVSNEAPDGGPSGPPAPSDDATEPSRAPDGTPATTPGAPDPPEGEGEPPADG
ncbi:hypothetical protein ER308_10970 [Egibacter rhizosphaerae]|uniref:Uncharacterized protein n=1 Tax=Egibacter rhizosphaerae TaxID=1670831 RepID=A0A411YFN4_9ACTN|nr:transglycosylase domain-containing protein [Egibacter rhizosphaerae]QBI20028.1 hypothetical protein ER308_10970 [Egibacter rhizosphaerae]